MEKSIHSIKIAYAFNPNRRGAHYTIDNIHFMNHGEFCEILTKSVLGFTLTKSPLPYDKGSDIPEIEASVKSNRFTLVNANLGNTLVEAVARYFETTHSKLWIYTIFTGNAITLYKMNSAEFKEFLLRFCYMNKRGRVRCRAISAKMLQWLEGKCPHATGKSKKFLI